MNREQLIEHFTTLPRKGTPVAELTDRDKVALGLAAGVEFESVMDGTRLSLRLLRPVGFADRGDGGYIIAIGSERLKTL